MSENVLIQSEVMRKNVGAIQEMQRQEAEHRTRQVRAAARLTDFSGPMAFVYIHAVLSLGSSTLLVLSSMMTETPHMSSLRCPSLMVIPSKSPPFW